MILSFLFLLAVVVQTTLSGFGIPILFTTALAVSSMNPVTTLAIQGVLYVTFGLLFSVVKVAADVNLDSILQEPLCDISCESFIDLMIACVYAPRSLDVSNNFFCEWDASSLDGLHRLLGSSGLFHLLWSVVLAWTLFGLSIRFHHPVYCRLLSSFVAFILCIGGPTNRIVVGIAAYLLPAFPARVSKNDGASSESSCCGEEADVDWAGIEVAIATSHSLDQTLMDDDLEAAKIASAIEALEIVDDEVDYDLPDFVQLHRIPGDGWCFYDCVLKHLFPNGQEGEESEKVTKAMVAGICVSCLAQRKEHLQEFLADSPDFRKKRIFALKKVKAYRPYVNSLDDFQIYVLDKLETVCNPPLHLDTYQYADSLEIEAFRKNFDLSMLRLRPFGTWKDDDIGTLHTSDIEVIKNVEHLRTLLASAEVDLKFLHHQYENFEHYNLISFHDRDVGIREEKKNTIVYAITQSSLLRSLLDQNVKEFRRIALLHVGVKADPSLENDNESDAEASDTSVEESVESSEEVENSSDGSESEVEENHTDTKKPSLPPDVPMPLHPRVRRNRLGEGNSTTTSCADGNLSNKPAGEATVADAPGKDFFLIEECVQLQTP